MVYASVNQLFAQWEQTNSLQDISALAVLTGGRGDTLILAGTSKGGGICISTDQGGSWIPTEAGYGIEAFAIFPSFGDTMSHLFAGTYAGVFLSTNDGANWTEVDSGLTDNNVNVGINALATSGSKVFAGTQKGVFVSTNKGASWSADSAGLPQYNQIEAFAVSGTNLFAGSYGGGVFLSTNNGVSWNAVNIGLTDKNVLHLSIADTSLYAGTWDGGIFLSTNNGTTWEAASSGLPSIDPTSPSEIDVSATTAFGKYIFASVVIGTSGGGVFESTDNGISWSEVGSGLPNTFINALAVSQTYLFAGTYQNGVWRIPLSNVILSVGNRVKQVPLHFYLTQNYPNPFNPSTTIKYQLPSSKKVVVKVFDVLGREVKTLIDEHESAGDHYVRFNATGLPSAVYFYRLQAGTFMETKKLTVMK
jgi:ligand-binding sensor domain-containing protein